MRKCQIKQTSFDTLVYVCLSVGNEM